MDCRLGAGARVLGRVWAHGGGAIRIGAGAVVDGRWAPVELHADAGAVLEIGEGAYLGPGTSIEALGAVRIGRGARLEALCKVLDSNFHPLTGDRTLRVRPVPVSIGDGAVLGVRAVVLPGAKVPAGARIPASAVVNGANRAGGEETFPPPRRGRLARAARTLGQNLVARTFLRGCDLGRRVRAGGRVIVSRGGPIRIGDHVVFQSGRVASELSTAEGARLVVGAGTNFNYGVTLEAHVDVSIGRGCQIASYVHVSDREAGRRAPVVVGDGVWLAHGVSIGPGVTVGEGAAVAALSVVRTDVPPAHLAYGNPARCVPFTFFERLATRAPETRAEPEPRDASRA